MNTEMADRYRMAEEIVLKRYATEPGSKGQCQKWKIKAIADDRKDGRLDTSVIELFIGEIEREVDSSIVSAIKPTAQEFPKKEPEKLSVVDKKPAEPIEPRLPENETDLGWD
jgi:hypothetical protein